MAVIIAPNFLDNQGKIVRQLTVMITTVIFFCNRDPVWPLKRVNHEIQLDSRPFHNPGHCGENSGCRPQFQQDSILGDSTTLLAK